MTTIPINDLNATEAFGAHLGSALFPGAIVALVGPLGAGKTHLVRAIAIGLDIANPSAVSSPTFVLIQEYPARLPIYHFDAYRLSGVDEFLELGALEYYEMGGVCLIEWADRVERALPAEHLLIEIVPLSADRREFRITARGERYSELLRQLQSSLPGHPESP